MDNENADYLYGMSISFSGTQDPHLAEMLALREGILVAHLLRVNSCSFIGDAQVVILEALDEYTCSFLCIPILEEIKDLLGTPP